MRDTSRRSRGRDRYDDRNGQTDRTAGYLPDRHRPDVDRRQRAHEQTAKGRLFSKGRATLVVSVTTDAPEFAPALARSHASDDVKTEILAITSASAPGAEADGWRYSKSGPRFSRLLCPCVTLHVEPGFTFIEKGLICLAQPLAWVQSDAFASALKQVFGQTGTGPALCSLRTLDRDRRLGELKRQFATPSVHFIDIDAPGFTPEKGYFQTEALPEYLASLRTTVAAIAAEDHSTTSEAAFLHGLPEACDPVTIATRFHCAPHGAASRIGWRGPLHCTAVGKVMLSQSGAPDSLDLTAQTARTITDRRRLSSRSAATGSRWMTKSSCPACAAWRCLGGTGRPCWARSRSPAGPGTFPILGRWQRSFPRSSPGRDPPGATGRSSSPSRPGPTLCLREVGCQFAPGLMRVCMPCGLAGTAPPGLAQGAVVHSVESEPQSPRFRRPPLRFRRARRGSG